MTDSRTWPDLLNDILRRLRPEGIVCANDYTAGQLMRTFNELSVAVPDEIRVTGMLPVPLTTLHQPCAEIGATAVAHMIQRLEDPSLPARDTLLDFHIVVRQSCGSKEVH